MAVVYANEDRRDVLGEMYSGLLNVASRADGAVRILLNVAEIADADAKEAAEAALAICMEVRDYLRALTEDASTAAARFAATAPVLPLMSEHISTYEHAERVVDGVLRNASIRQAIINVGIHATVTRPDFSVEGVVNEYIELVKADSKYCQERESKAGTTCN